MIISQDSFVYAFFKTLMFYTDPKYSLYIYLVLNDITMLFISVFLQVMSYTVPFVNVTICCFLLVLASATSEKNSTEWSWNGLGAIYCHYIHTSYMIQTTASSPASVKRIYIFIILLWLFSIVPVLTDIIITLLYQPIIFFFTSIMCYNKSRFSSNKYKLISQIHKQ